MAPRTTSTLLTRAPLAAQLVKVTVKEVVEERLSRGGLSYKALPGPGDTVEVWPHRRPTDRSVWRRPDPRL